jgi:DNA-binding PadR family transcriptional regulator
LYVIAGSENPHGLGIKDDLEEYYETEIRHGRLYPNLDTLVEKGLIEKGQKD